MTRARRPKGPTPEEAFARQVLDLAKLLRWRSAHFRPAETGRGWRTAVAGDGVGFPDLVLLKGRTLLVAELKVPPNVPTAEQLDWLAAFRAAGTPAYLWTPADWPEIEKVLKAGEDATR